MDNLTIIIKQNDKVLRIKLCNNYISNKLKKAYWNCLLAKEYIKYRLLTMQNPANMSDKYTAQVSIQKLIRQKN